MHDDASSVDPQYSRVHEFGDYSGSDSIHEKCMCKTYARITVCALLKGSTAYQYLFFFSLGLSHEGQIEFCNVYFIYTALKYIAIFYNDYIPA